MSIVKTFFLVTIGFGISVSAQAQETTKKTEKPELATPAKTISPTLLPVKANDGQVPAKIPVANQDKEEFKPQLLKDGSDGPKSVSTLATEIKDVKDPPVLPADQSSKITTTPPVKKPKTTTATQQRSGNNDQ